MTKLNATQVHLTINGKPTKVALTKSLQQAHGTGLDGRKVESLMYGTAAEYPGKVFIQDSQNNVIMTDVNELFVALQHAAPAWNISATKK